MSRVCVCIRYYGVKIITIIINNRHNNVLSKIMEVAIICIYMNMNTYIYVVASSIICTWYVVGMEGGRKGEKSRRHYIHIFDANAVAYNYMIIFIFTPVLPCLHINRRKAHEEADHDTLVNFENDMASSTSSHLVSNPILSNGACNISVLRLWLCTYSTKSGAPGKMTLSAAMV